MQQTFRKFFNRKMSYSILSNATPIISTADKLLLEDNSYLLLENNVDKMLLEDGWLVKEDFENGQPAEWTTGGIVDFAYNTAPAPLVGNYSLATQSAFSNTSKVFPESYREIWFFFKYYAPSGNNSNIFSLNSSLGSQFSMQLRTDRIRCFHGSSVMEYTSITPHGSPIVIWGRYKAETTINNGEFTLYANINSSSEIRPIAQINASNGNGGQINSFAIVSPNAAGNFICDKFRISEKEIGSSPE